MVWDAPGHDHAAWGKALMGSDVPIRVLGGDLSGGLADDFALSRRIAWDIETTGLDWRREKIGTCQLFAEAVGAVGG